MKYYEKNYVEEEVDKRERARKKKLQIKTICCRIMLKYKSTT